MNKEKLEKMIEEIKNLDLSQHQNSIWDSDEISGREAQSKILRIIYKYVHEAEDDLK